MVNDRSDVKNGNWAILGAREGLNMTMLSDWDYVQVRDFEYPNELWGGRDPMPEDILHQEIWNRYRTYPWFRYSTSCNPLMKNKVSFLKQ